MYGLPSGVERGHDGGVKLRAGATLELRTGLRRVQRAAVRAVGAQLLVGVGDDHDAGLECLGSWRVIAV